MAASACGTSTGGPDEPQTAEFSVFCVGLACDFDPFSVPDGAVSWFWSFGDGAASTSRNASHAYIQQGDYEVTLTIATAEAIEVSHTAGVSLRDVVVEPSAPEVIELDYQASEAGHYVTRWNHPEPAIEFTMEDGWWAADTLTSLYVGSLSEAGRSTCDPMVRVVAPRAWFDSEQGVMEPIDDVVDSVTSDSRIRVESVESTSLGGRPAERIEATIDEDDLDARWRSCGTQPMRMFAAAAFDSADPAFRWIWLPATSPHLTLWVVDVEGRDMLVVGSLSDPSSREAVDALVATIRFSMTPEPDLTRTLHSPLGVIDIYSGTPKLHAWTDWAASRFVAAGLGSPQVTSVTFSASVACRERGYSGGFTETTNGAVAVRLCFGEERTDAVARQTVLHEFAHAWLIAAELDTSFVQLVIDGLDEALGEPREHATLPRATELAADLIVWGLHDGSTVPPSFGGASCSSLASAYRLLTGADPLTEPDGCR